MKEMRSYRLEVPVINEINRISKKYDKSQATVIEYAVWLLSDVLQCDLAYIDNDIVKKHFFRYQKNFMLK